MRRRADKRYAITIDPGFAAVGAGVVELAPRGSMNRAVYIDVWITEKSDKKRGVRAADDDFERARLLSKKLLELFDMFAPVVVIAEAKSPVRNASAAAKIAMMVGALACEVQRRDLPYVQASPQDVRIALGLKKGATKDDVQRVVSTRIVGNLAGMFADLAKMSSTVKIAEGLSKHPWDALAAFVACENSDVVRALSGHRVIR